MLIFLLPIFFFLVQIGYNYYFLDVFQISYNRSVSRLINNQVVILVLMFEYYAMQVIRYSLSQSPLGQLLPYHRFIIKWKLVLLGIPLISYLAFIFHVIANSSSLLIILIRIQPVAMILSLLRVILIIGVLLFIILRFEKLPEFVHLGASIIMFTYLFPSLYAVWNIEFFGFDVNGFAYTLNIGNGQYVRRNLIYWFSLSITAIYGFIWIFLTIILAISAILIYRRQNYPHKRTVFVLSVGYWGYILLDYFLIPTYFDRFIYRWANLNFLWANIMILITIPFLVYFFRLDKINFEKLKSHFISKSDTGKLAIFFILIISIGFLPWTQVYRGFEGIDNSPNSSFTNTGESFSLERPGYYSIFFIYHQGNTFTYGEGYNYTTGQETPVITKFTQGELIVVHIQVHTTRDFVINIPFSFNSTNYSQLETILEYRPNLSVFSDITTWYVLIAFTIAFLVLKKENQYAS